jgi:hypothetical protein
MMRVSRCFRVFLAAVPILAGGCAEKASPDDFRRLCRLRLDLANVAQPIPQTDPVPEVKARHEAELAAIEQEATSELARLDREMQEAMSGVDFRNAFSVRREYDQKKDEVRRKTLERYREAKERHAREMTEAEHQRRRLEEAERRIEKCVERYTTERPTVEKTKCQSAAATLDAFDSCRDPFGASYTERCLSGHVPFSNARGETFMELLERCTLELEDPVIK